MLYGGIVKERYRVMVMAGFLGIGGVEWYREVVTESIYYYYYGLFERFGMPASCIR
jgi:hypothetical protein